MSNLENPNELISQIPIQDVYNDIAQPTCKSTGKLIELIPRAINVALEPLHKWILTKEYNIAETKKLLELKLENISPDNIVPPEPYVAVPALQAISYCMDNEILRNMYANLLATSMTKTDKDNVHPAFVEIIRQILPDEARIIRNLYKEQTAPVIWLYDKLPNNIGRKPLVKNFSILGELAECEHFFETPKYLDNLSRLKLIHLTDSEFITQPEGVYDDLTNHTYIKDIMSKELKEGHSYDIQKGFAQMSLFGNSFCKVCVLD